MDNTTEKPALPCGTDLDKARADIALTPCYMDSKVQPLRWYQGVLVVRTNDAGEWVVKSI